MAVSSQEDEFLEAAVAAIPRIAELIAALPSAAAWLFAALNVLIWLRTR